MAKMSQESLKHNLSNPAKTYLWEVLFSNPIGGGDAETLMLRCQSTAMPGRSVGEILVPYKQGPGIKFPGKLTMSHTWTCTFIEGTDRRVFKALHAWQESIVSAKTNVGGPDIFVKADIYLRLLDMRGRTFQKIRFVGAYVENVDDIPLAYDDESSIKYDVTFSYDHWEDVS
jgi:hypothetical protein